MAKMSKLQRSQAAHKRWYKHHDRAQRTDPKKYDEHFVKASYHFNCIHRQNKLGRMLSKEEKRKHTLIP